MATPYEHYVEAEKVMDKLAVWRSQRVASGRSEITPVSAAIEANILAEAQFHATMAQAPAIYGGEE